MLGTIAGIWVSIIILAIALVIACVSAFSSKSLMQTADKQSILYLNLRGAISERNQPGTLMEYVQNGDKETLSLDEMLQSLALAADDDAIKGVYIDCDGASMGVASREELLEALRNFKKSGKWVYSYADTYNQGDYLISTVADTMYLNPVGSVDLRGVAVMTPFFKGLLDKVGVKVQVVKVGTYKSAVEPYILSSMSEPARLQLQVCVDSIWNFMSTNIAANRKVSLSAVNNWADGIMATWSADSIASVKAVTALKYRRDVENQLRALTNTDSDKDLPTVTPSEYLSNNAPSLKSIKSHIAILYAVGDIVDEGDGISGRDMVPEITKLADDKNVCGLVLRVNSGGGSAFASEQIWEALQYFKSKDKPFYVSMGDYAASGGYYISCGADKIYADKTTLTGSIGVFGMIPDFSGLATDKLGVTFSTVESNENAGFMTLVQPMTETQQAAMQNSVNNIYEKFVSRVAAGRHLKVETVKSIAEGRVWIGSSAKQLKLVDELGSLDKAVQDIAKSVGLKKTDVVRYPEIEENVWMQLVQQAGSVSVGGMTLDKNTVLMLHFVEKLRTMNPIQARMQETVVL